MVIKEKKGTSSSIKRVITCKLRVVSDKEGDILVTKKMKNHTSGKFHVFRSQTEIRPVQHWSLAIAADSSASTG